MSEVVKIVGRLGRMRVSSPLPRIETITLPPLAGEEVQEPTSEAPVAKAIQQEDLQALLAEEYRRGFQDGLEHGRSASAAAADQRLNEEHARVGAYLVTLRKECAKVTARLEQEAFRFAVAVAGKIVKREVTLDDEIALRQIQEGIRRVVGVESLKLRINPRDEAMVRANKALIMATTQSVRDIVIETDDKLDPGGCILETPSGTVDARVFTQLEQIEAALFGQVVG